MEVRIPGTDSPQELRSQWHNGESSECLGELACLFLYKEEGVTVGRGRKVR